jgi:hypothetical protein
MLSVTIDLRTTVQDCLTMALNDFLANCKHTKCT